MKLAKKISTSFGVGMAYLSLPFVALGATTCPKGTICNPIAGIANDIPTFIKTILEGAIKIGIPILALAIIYSGFLFVAARGNSEKLGKAKDTLLYTLIGSAILLGAWAIAEIIAETVTGISN